MRRLNRQKRSLFQLATDPHRITQTKRFFFRRRHCRRKPRLPFGQDEKAGWPVEPVKPV
jgi:hypothetical protein